MALMDNKFVRIRLYHAGLRLFLSNPLASPDEAAGFFNDLASKGQFCAADEWKIAMKDATQQRKLREYFQRFCRPPVLQKIRTRTAVHVNQLRSREMATENMSSSEVAAAILESGRYRLLVQPGEELTQAQWPSEFYKKTLLSVFRLTSLASLNDFNCIAGLALFELQIEAVLKSEREHATKDPKAIRERMEEIMDRQPPTGFTIRIPEGPERSTTLDAVYRDGDGVIRRGARKRGLVSMGGVVFNPHAGFFAAEGDAGALEPVKEMVNKRLRLLRQPEQEAAQHTPDNSALHAEVRLMRAEIARLKSIVAEDGHDFERVMASFESRNDTGSTQGSRGAAAARSGSSSGSAAAAASAASSLSSPASMRPLSTTTSHRRQHARDAAQHTLAEGEDEEEEASEPEYGREDRQRGRAQQRLSMVRGEGSARRANGRLGGIQDRR